MIFTVVEGANKSQTYEGFCWDTSKEGRKATVIARVAFEDGFEYWGIDPEHIELGIGELQRYYRAEYCADVEPVLFDRRPNLAAPQLEDGSENVNGT